MIDSEAHALIDLMRELWQSRYFWTPGIIGLWTERLARPEFDRKQCEAVIRQFRAECEGDNAKKPPMKAILGRCWDVHRTVKQKGIVKPDDTPVDWPMIQRERQEAAAWWEESKPYAGEVVAKATAAYPMWKPAWVRFLDPLFRPNLTACMALKCAYQRFSEHGGWEGSKRDTLDLAESGLLG